MSRVKLEVINLSNNPLPKYATPGSSGMDLRADLPNGSVTLKPGEIKIIPTGIKVNIPEGYELQLRARSGLSCKGITLANGIGTVDCDFHDEIKVILINLGSDQFTINDNDRIAQAVLMKYEKAVIELVDIFEDTNDRGGGFGHTGIN